MKRILLSLFFCAPAQAAWFGYDRAIGAARRGDSAQAALLLSDELTARPDNSSLLYDAGVLAYRQKNYAQAHAFFSKAVGATQTENPLHRQALFNLGNACVGEQKLREALDAYNQLLTIDPAHEKARHNRDKVKKMLELQSQDKNSDDNGQNDTSPKDKSQNDKNSQGNNQQQKTGNGTQQQNNQQAGDKDASDSKQQSGDQKDEGSQQQGNTSSQDKKTKGQKSGEKKTEGQKDGSSGNHDNHKRDGKNNNQLDEHDRYKERYGERHHDGEDEDEQGSGADMPDGMKDKTDTQKDGSEESIQQHDKSPSRASRETLKGDTHLKSMNLAGKAQESSKKEPKKQYAAWAEAMLDAVQLNDESLNKVLVQRAVAGKLGGRDGECCW